MSQYWILHCLENLSTKNAGLAGPGRCWMRVGSGGWVTASPTWPGSWLVPVPLRASHRVFAGGWESWQMYVVSMYIAMPAPSPLQTLDRYNQPLPVDHVWSWEGLCWVDLGIFWQLLPDRYLTSHASHITRKDPGISHTLAEYWLRFREWKLEKWQTQSHLNRTNNANRRKLIQNDASHAAVVV